jgi:energy-coupling factor transport system permease protein
MAVIVALVYAVCLFFVQDWVGIVLAVAALAASMAVLHTDMQAVLLLGVPVYVIVAFVLLANALQGAWETGLLYGVRLILLAFSAAVVTFAYDDTALLMAFTWYLKPIRRRTAAAEDAAMTLAIALRYIPVTWDEYQRIQAAQISRGADSGRGGIVARLRRFASGITALFIGLFRHADALSVAMDARCFGAHRRTQLMRMRLGTADVAFAVVAVTACVICAIAF